MSHENEIYYATPTHVTKGTALLPDHSWFVAIKRPYGFDFGDERRVGKREAFKRAQERASETGFTQQIKLTEGPLFGQTIWLIQSCGGSRIWEGHRVILDERGFVEPGLITTYEELEALPVGTVIQATLSSLKGRKRVVRGPYDYPIIDREGNPKQDHKTGFSSILLPYRVVHEPETYTLIDESGHIWTFTDGDESWDLYYRVTSGRGEWSSVGTSVYKGFDAWEHVVDTHGFEPVEPQPVLGELVIGELTVGGLTIRSQSNAILDEEQVVEGQGSGTVIARTVPLEPNRWYRITTTIEAL